MLVSQARPALSPDLPRPGLERYPVLRTDTALEQAQLDGSVLPISFISRATLNSERHWTPLDLEAGSTVWVIKRLRCYLRSNFVYFRTTKR